MNKSLFYFLLFAFASVTWTACGDDDLPMEEENEEELITTINVALSSPTDAVTLTFVDIDGDGGDDPVITGGSLDANSTYSFSTTFLNESVTPTEDITEEVEEEGVDHYVSYGSGSLNFDVMLSDMDDNGDPIGLTGTLTTGDAGTGELQVILLHESTKTATGATGGSTDADVSFPITVE
ncbi:MAG: type 1 periplasmic binding fold superfamily protein [Saprospiraceae bacterium]